MLAVLVCVGCGLGIAFLTGLGRVVTVVATVGLRLRHEHAVNKTLAAILARAAGVASTARLPAPAPIVEVSTTVVVSISVDVVVVVVELISISVDAIIVVVT
jgi:hypothetical protein